MFLEGGCLKHISDTKDLFVVYVKLLAILDFIQLPGHLFI